nr:PREDICTED: HEAT repeat-containing protein 6 [Bemisia tabaci]
MSSPPFQIQKFENCVKKLSSIVNFRSKGDGLIISEILDELNSLDFNIISVKPEKAALSIHHLCSLVSSSDEALAAKCCQLIVSYVLKQNVQIGGSILSLSVHWCLEAIKYAETFPALCNLLQGLEALLRSNNLNDLDSVPNLVEYLLQPLDTNVKLSNSTEVRLFQLKCLQNLSSHLSPQQADLVLAHVSEFMQNTQITSNDDFYLSEVFLSGLELMRQLCSDEWLSSNLGRVLGVCICFASYGLPNVEFHHPSTLYPSPGYQYQPPAEKSANKKGNKVRLRKRKKLKEDGKSEEADHEACFPGINFGPKGTLGALTSDSDSSDVEYRDFRVGLKLKKLQLRVRMTALLLLLKITEMVDFKEIFGYWTALFRGNLSLLNVLIKDSSVRMTPVITTVIYTLLSNSKLFLAQAQQSERNETAAFTPFSATLAELLCYIHNQFNVAIKQFLSVHRFPALLHCVSSLIMNTPYHRLKPGLITELLRNIYSALHHKETDVAVAAITCISTIAAIDPKTEEQEQLFLCGKPPNFQDMIPTVDEPWIISLAIQSLEAKKEVTPIQVEYLQLIKVLAKNNHKIFSEKVIESLLAVLVRNLQEEDNAVVQLHSVNVVEQISAYLQLAGLKDLSLNLWSSLLGGPLIPLFQQVKGQLPAAACDCLTALGSSTFSELDSRLQSLCVSLVFGCAGHEEPTVRAAAIQVIGTFLSYPSLVSDVQFVSDASKSVVDLMTDKSLFVRMKASWALANLSDIFLVESSMKSCLVISPLLKTCMNAAQDHDKVKWHGVRALGNILRVISDSELETLQKEDIITATSILITNASSSSLMKVRWNACYAIGNLLKNSYLHSYSADWQSNVFKVLSNLALECSNFKVRLTACAALVSVPSRELYKEHYLPLWPTFIQALENSQSITDFTEYKHQHNLIDQICLSISYLAKLCRPEDLDHIEEILIVNVEMLKDNFVKFHNRVVPEKSSELSEATSYLLSLLDSGDVSKRRSETICILISLFTNDVI